MSGIIAVRNFVLLTFLAAAFMAAAGSFANATLASSTSTDPVIPPVKQIVYNALQGDAEEGPSGDACAAALAVTTLNPVEVRCSAVIERPGNGAFVSGSAGVTVKDLDGNPVVSFDQPVGRTGAATTGSLTPTYAITNRTIVPAGVVCAPLVGCNDAVDGPANAQVRVLPGGSATTVNTAGGGGTVTVTETCVNTAGGGCGTSGSPAEVSKVAITRS